MKKLLGIFAIFILMGGFFLLTRPKKEAVVAPKVVKKALVRPIEELAEAERPKVNLSLSNDVHYFYLKVSEIKNFASVEYELIYLVSGVQQGFNSTIDLKPEETSFNRELLRGTCSSGKCRYEEGLPTSGTLTLIFRDEKDYKAVYQFSVEKQAGKYVVVME